MTRRWLFYGFLGLAFYLVFLLATAPAAWMSWALVRASRGTLSIDRPAGTVWRGRGDLVVHIASSPPQSLGAARWVLHPLWLFAGQVRAHAAVRGPGTEVQADLGLGYHRIILSNAAASFPAQLISALYSPAALLSPAGRIQFNAKQFMVDSKNVSGGAVVQWHQAASSLSSIRPLGDYRLSLDGHGRNAVLRLQTLSGNLALNGSGSWDPGSGRVQFNGMAKPTDHAAALEPLLRLFGPDRGNGMRTLDLQWNAIPLSMGSARSEVTRAA
ncbi:MAG: type II secretion system protein N [Acidiferrobacterales bacterium]